MIRGGDLGRDAGRPELSDWTPNPLFNCSLPKLIEGDIARNVGMVFNMSGWASLLPLAVDLGIVFCLPMKSCSETPMEMEQ